MNELETLCREINLPAEETACALGEAEKYPAATDAFAEKMRRGHLRALTRRSPAFKLAVTLKAALLAREEYRRRGIPEDIFTDTFSDITVWSGNDRARYGVVGLDNIGWLSRHVRLRLFKIGRLQYELSRFVAPPFGNVANFLRALPLMFGRILNLHIQQGEPLASEACDVSFARATAFFARFFPNYRYTSFTICSWVLNPALADVIGVQSNIVKFAKRFTLLGAFPDTDMNARRLFGYGTPRSEYVGDNALRAYALSRLNANKPLLSYFGYIRIK